MLFAHIICKKKTVKFFWNLQVAGAVRARHDAGDRGEEDAEEDEEGGVLGVEDLGAVQAGLAGIHLVHVEKVRVDVLGDDLVAGYARDGGLELHAVLPFEVVAQKGVPVT